MAGGISEQTKAELLAVLSDRYGGSSKKEKGRILDEFVAVSGYHRKHAIRPLSHRAFLPPGWRNGYGRWPRQDSAYCTHSIILPHALGDKFALQTVRAYSTITSTHAPAGRDTDRRFPRGR